MATATVVATVTATWATRCPRVSRCWRRWPPFRLVNGRWWCCVSFHDYTEAATAEAMGTSVGTVKSQTFKALAALRISEELCQDPASDLTGSAREGMTR